MRRLYIYIIGVACLLAGCQRGETADEQLAAVRQMIAADSVSAAIERMDSLHSSVDGWKRSQRMRYYLLLTQAQNKADTIFTSDSLQRILVDYYDGRDANDAMLAHYLLGRAYQDMGEAPKALECFHDAIDHADTTTANCDYRTLIGIYGQMASIFHQQNLPQDEIEAIRNYAHCAIKTGDTLSYCIFTRNLTSPYYRLNKKDSVLLIIETMNKQLENRGYAQEAACGLGMAIWIHIERGELSKAKKLLNIFENESGLFDANGNIIKGMEGHYWVKGFYFVKANQIDSAEYYFRKAARTCTTIDDKSCAYNGLLAVYEQKRNIDSILLYSKLHEEALDTLHDRMRTDAIHQAAVLYDYTRFQKEAEQESTKRREAWQWFWILFATVAIASVAAIRFYRKRQRERKERILQLSSALSAVRTEQLTVQNELRLLKDRNYESLIAEKERREQTLTQRIAELEAEANVPSEPVENHFDDFKNSQIVAVFAKKSLFTREHPAPNKSEWNALVRQFQKDMPAAYKAFHAGKKLSPLELYTCILLMLDYEESTIVGLTETSSPAVSTAKSRANQKLFGEKSAVTLKYNLEKTISLF